MNWFTLDAMAPFVAALLTIILLRAIEPQVGRRLFGNPWPQDNNWKQRLEHMETELDKLKKEYEQKLAEQRRFYEAELARLRERVEFLVDALRQNDLPNPAMPPPSSAKRQPPAKIREIVILGLWPHMTGTPPLSARAEADAMANSGLDYSPLMGEEADRRRIVRELGRRNYTVIHIGGHGQATTVVGDSLEGGIILADGLANPAWWARLASSSKLLLFVIMGCETDDLGDALLRAGVPAVVTCQRGLADRQAVQFTLGLYENLAEGMGLAEAVSYAKLTLDSAAAEMIRLHGQDPWK